MPKRARSIVGFITAAAVTVSTALVPATASATASAASPQTKLRPVTLQAPPTAKPSPRPTGLPTLEDGYGATPQQKAAMAQASAQARRSGKPVVVEGLTTETQQVEAQPKGGFTLAGNPEPVRTEQHDAWVPVDLTLHRAANGSVAPAATAYGTVTFSGGGTGPLATTTSGATSFSLSWPSPLPAPALDGSTAVYADVLPGVDLRMSATRAGGFSDVLVVKTRQAAANPALASLRLAMATANGTAAAGPHGGVTVTSKGGSDTLSASTPLMWDSNTSNTAADAKPDGHIAPLAGSADPSDAAHPGVAANVAQVATHIDSRELDLSADRKLLSTGVLPIYIDPSFNWHPTTGGTPAFDEVKQGSPCTNTSFFNQSNGPDNDYGELGVGYNNWNSCIGVERAYYQWQLPQTIWGAHIGNVSGQPGATVNVTKVMSSACVTSSAYLYWSGGIGPGTSWNSQPGLIGQIGGTNVAHTGSCPGFGATVSAGFDVTSQIAQSAANHSSQFSVGLLGNETPGLGNVQFSRYSDNPTLQIFYNLPPNTPGANEMSAGSGTDNAGCATSIPYPYMGKTLATNTPVLSANVSDPDGDNLQATFKYWVQTPSGPVNQSTGTSADDLASGSTAQFSLPPSFVASLSNGQEVDWQAQVSDGEDPSGWSPVCHFVAEPTAPSAPSIASADGRYPNNGKVGAAAGSPGRFTFASTGGIVSKLVQRMDQAPDSVNPPAGEVAPFNGGGVIGSAGRWKLADGGGTSAADATSSHPARLTGGASWVNDPHRGEVLSLDGSTGYAQTNSQVINTSGSFTVSAWVNPSSLANGFTILGQDSVYATGFYLEYVKSDNRWSFSRLATDTANAPAIRAESAGAPQLGVWTHLVGEYDDSKGTLTLYVNGQIQGGSPIDSTPYSAAGPFTIGRGQWNISPGGYVPGLISDVQAYQAALSPGDVAQVYAGNNGPAGRWKLADGSGTGAADSAGSHPATLNGGASWVGDASRGTVLSVDGTSGYAATSGPVLNTAGSFTVSAWVNPAAFPAGNGNGGILSADGTNSSSFYLYLASGCSCWAFGVSPSDAPSVNLPAAISTGANLDTWTHLTGVYNAATQTEQIYVNGKLATAVPNITAWNAGGALAIGRYKWSGQSTGFFSGKISDVQTYQAALSPNDIAQIYAGTTAGPSAVIAPNGRWHLLEGNGTSAADTSGGADPAAFHGGATWWAPTTDSPAVQFDGSTGYLATSGPVVDTAGSFTVSAWANPSVAKSMAVLGQDGDRESAFYLEYVQSDNKWSFSRLTSDDSQAIRAESVNAPQTGAWTHLAGTYDASTGAMSLYVNGQLQSTQTNTSPYNGTGAFTIGRARSAGAPAGFFDGAISDVQTYPTALDASEVAQIDSSSTLAITPLSPGPHTMYAYATDDTGDFSGYQSYDFVAGHDPITPCTSLAACFNNTAISPTGTTSQSADADGTQNSFSSDDLHAAGWIPGGQVTVNGATFTLPQFGSGQPDNLLAASQKIDYSYTVSKTGSSALEFLTTATTASTPAPGSINGDTTAPYVPAGTEVAGSYCFDSTKPAAWCAPQGSITYSDGTVQTYDLTVPDWITGPASLAAVVLPHENTAAGQNTNQPKLYPFAVPLLPGKSIKSVTLPDVGTSIAGGRQALHIFGMAIRDTTVDGAPAGQTWTGTWGAPTEGLFNNGAAFSNVTMREVVKPSVSGNTVRIKFDDALGTTPLSIGHATIALDSGDGTWPSPIPSGAMKSLTFGGSQSVTIPQGGMLYSDPTSFAVPANQYVVVSFQLSNTVPAVVSHSATNSTGVEFVTGNGAGDQTADTTGTPFTTNGGFGSQSTSVVTDVDVATAGTGTEAVIGDGYIDQAQTKKLPTASNNLAAVVTATDATTPAPLGLISEGIESNQIMTDYPEAGGSGLSGPALLSRIDRDILDQPGLTTVIVDEGLEDILGGRSAADLSANGYTMLINYLQNSGINIITAGLTPCDGYAGDGANPDDTCTAAVDKQRVSTNGFLAGNPNSLGSHTTPSYFFINSDNAVGIPDTGNGETKLNPAADAGDHVNLTDAGFAALGTALLGAQDSWPLNDGGTSTSATDAADRSSPYLSGNPAAGNNPATLTGGATWTSDTSHGEVLSLDGTSGSAVTGNGAVLDTAGSFSVSAWVNPTTLPSSNASVLSQDGTNSSAFYLLYTASSNSWSFAVSPSDSPTVNLPLATSSGPVTANTWTHLVGVYNAATKTEQLYVNGVLTSSVNNITSWSAGGDFAIGRDKWNGASSGYFPGKVSDAQAWNYALTPTQISALYQQVD